ncbi:MAG: MarR family transcriptional regulator [Oscillospiraceae bacterium]|nr:MarR family transcriptional regulator [Oscillospiraceae bacterium]
MELEHEIMKSLMRIASGGRRRHSHPPRSGQPRFCGYGHILDLLSQKDGLSQREIAEALNIRPQSASEAIASMENQSLIEKRANELDKRSSLVYITQMGRQRQIDLRNERIENARRIFAPLTDEEKTTLLELLNKAASALQENKEEC